jgi:glycosyltransferase involved in cell wall biosynthesis
MTTGQHAPGDGTPDVGAAATPDGLPLVTVVIATHHRPELLRVALDAVAAQDYAGPIETVVVFDQSEPDASLARDDRQREVRVVSNTERTPGLAGARNTGILAARGDLVAFCDDDDSWRPEKIRLQVAALAAEPDALTAVSGITVMYDDRSVDRVPQPGDVTLAQLARRRVMEAHPSSVVVRRSALLGAIGLVDEEIPGSYGEDYDWILRAAQAGPIAVVPRSLVAVRWGQSLFSQRWTTILAWIEYALAKHPVLSADPRGLARLLGQRAFALAALGRRREALRVVGQVLRRNPREPRGWLAAAVALRLVTAKRAMHAAHRRGRGV